MNFYKTRVLRITLILITTIVIFTVPAEAQFEVRYTLAPSLDRYFGYTKYFMNLIEQAEIDGQIHNVSYQSELEFPVDVFMAGLYGDIQLYQDGQKFLIIEGGFYKNINDPSSVMKDSDWLGVDAARFKFSYTESDPLMDQTIWYANLKTRLTSWKAGRLYFQAGFRYQKMKQDEPNFTGWQIDLSDPDFPRYQIDTVVHALYYDVTYKSPFLGLALETHAGRFWNLEIAAAYSRVSVKDYDDHLLRHKYAAAEGNGNGFLGSIALQYRPGSRRKSVQPFVSLDIGLNTSKIETDQTQIWYGDDEATPGIDDTGSSLSGIPHDISTTQYKVGIKVGLEL